MQREAAINGAYSGEITVGAFDESFAEFGQMLGHGVAGNSEDLSRRSESSVELPPTFVHGGAGGTVTLRVLSNNKVRCAGRRHRKRVVQLVSGIGAVRW